MKLIRLIRLEKIIKTCIGLKGRFDLSGWERFRLNVYLLLGIIMLVVYFLFSSLNQYQFPECKVGDISKTADTSPIHERVPFSTYEKLLSKRSIFAAPVGKKVVTSPSISASEMLGRLSLVGIISVDGNPQALIRDKEKRKDYFCTGGETIRIFKVERIFEDKVILKYGDEELELSLIVGEQREFLKTRPSSDMKRKNRNGV